MSEKRLLIFILSVTGMMFLAIGYTGYLKHQETKMYIEKGYHQTRDNWGRPIWVKEDK